MSVPKDCVSVHIVECWFYHSLTYHFRSTGIAPHTVLTISKETREGLSKYSCIALEQGIKFNRSTTAYSVTGLVTHINQVVRILHVYQLTDLIYSKPLCQVAKIFLELWSNFVTLFGKISSILKTMVKRKRGKPSIFIFCNRPVTVLEISETRQGFFHCSRRSGLQARWNMIRLGLLRS